MERVILAVIAIIMVLLVLDLLISAFHWLCDLPGKIKDFILKQRELRARSNAFNRRSEARRLAKNPQLANAEQRRPLLVRIPTAITRYLAELLFPFLMIGLLLGAGVLITNTFFS